MDSLIDRLQQQTDGMDPSGLDPSQHLAGVVRRGRRHRAVATTVGALGTTLVLAGTAVAVPYVVGLLDGPTQPTVAATPDGGPADEVTEPDQAPVEEPLVIEEEPQPSALEAPAPAPTEEPATIDTVPPALEVLSPADGATVESSKVTFSGTTEPGATVVVGDWEATVDDDGRWSILLIAAKGLNTVTFAATDPAGNTTTRTSSVRYEPPQAKDEATAEPKQTSGKEEPKEQPGDATLTASQQSALLTSAPHKNLYSGTAAPGAKVAVVSEYGVNYAWAGDGGQWEVWVDFDPPGGETTFPVTVKLYNQPDVRKTFELTTVAEDVAAFTASQQSSSVPASAPTNVYSGTGEPGHEVWIWTETHGQFWTVVGGDGTWQVQVTYAEVAPGDVFAVKAKDVTSGSKHYFEVAITE